MCLTLGFAVDLLAGCDHEDEHLVEDPRPLSGSPMFSAKRPKSISVGVLHFGVTNFKYDAEMEDAVKNETTRRETGEPKRTARLKVLAWAFCWVGTSDLFRLPFPGHFLRWPAHFCVASACSSDVLGLSVFQLSQRLALTQDSVD